MGEDILLSDVRVGGGGFFEWLDPGQWISVLVGLGDNPLQAMWWFIAHGGWVILVLIFLWMLKYSWLNYITSKAAAKKEWVLLAIDVPRASEQTCKAIDNMFAHMAGGHSPPTFLEKWTAGHVQDTITLEIISIEGHLQYLIRTSSKLRDLVEASIYAQYPEAEITMVEDYTRMVPDQYPNDLYDCFGTEMVPVKSDAYPLKTYLDFEDSLSGEFKDPLAVLLEAMSRLGPGEQCWYQIVLTPIDQKAFVAKAQKEIMKLTGQKAPVKKNLVEKALDLPIQAMSTVADVAFGGGDAASGKKVDNPLQSRMWNLTPGERKVVEAIEKKMGHIQYEVKLRFLYIAKHEVFTKSKILQSFVGSMKQYNSNDLLSIKPEGKYIGVSSAIVLFKERRNNDRKGKLVRAYRNRSNWAGASRFHLGTDEIAALWHLPVVMQVKAPQLKKTEAKKAEPPINIPFA
ncbi:hypothetical protein KJZ71_01610 [Patescibacteria group bacterium]|uniref:DUF8128 domain-containing protein n=1 Tax=candidate division WWE3 bacterium TaxID=2053526 RepID=A0A928TQX8_UNCKA|nr:hypothetical protein [candidate division WWE3 bacterium]MCL4732483.1 hypothetical protein [Patescibacteria group bacterium]MDL1952609.1 hypothetical protein [Candidatus Uhrbacteria bacterium UHB]RIL01259.1 MAG: hypothetical protein DCC77_01830 [Candidatus Uhrbacteria bacterium]